MTQYCMTYSHDPAQLERWNTRFAALEILHLRTHDDVVDEGPGHRGMSALIDLVARRTG